MRTGERGPEESIRYTIRGKDRRSMIMDLDLLDVFNPYSYWVRIGANARTSSKVF